jgi:Cys-tRNA(Pro)/Cys-tRNA(Cys) deacylase
MDSINTRITALLDSHNIPYRLLPHSEPVFTVEAAAAQRGVVKKEMVKSILLRDRDGRYVMACVTGDAHLDPKAVRAQLPPETKRLSFASADEVEAVTGSVQGAVAPLCLTEGVPVIFDKGIALCARVNISSGDPMAGLELDPRDLIRLAGAILAPVAVRGAPGERNP